MAVCPVYSVLRREEAVARGKLALIRAHWQGNQPPSRRLRRDLGACLLCASCTQSCPNHVDTVSVIQAARAELARQGKGSRLQGMILRRLLPSKRAWPALLKAGRASWILWAKRVPPDSGLYLRLLRGPGGTRRRLPGLARPFFLEREIETSWSGVGRRVAIFTGCVGNIMRPQSVEGAIRALKQKGYSTKVPKDQGCCGLLAYAAGQTQAARRLAIRNLNAFLPKGKLWPTIITSPCASCAYMLKKHLPELLCDDPDMDMRAGEFSDRVVPFSQVWSGFAGNSRPGTGQANQIGPRLTYHDPCHLSRGFGEKDAPRHLLTSLGKACFVEMGHPCKCCGHGGIFQVSRYQLSLDIAERKVKEILASGADILVTECSGCLLQLSDVMARVRPGFEVITTAEAVDRFGLAPSYVLGAKSEPIRGAEN